MPDDTHPIPTRPLPPGLAGSATVGGPDAAEEPANEPGGAGAGPEASGPGGQGPGPDGTSAGSPPTRTAGQASVTTGSTGSPPRRWGRLLVEWGIVVVVALVVALCVRSFVFETFFIPSASMEPTLAPGDRIVVDKLSFHLHAVDVGDIVVFKRPADWPREYADLVKRVIGVPGETLWVHGGNVYVDPAACGAADPCTGPTVTAPVTGTPMRELAERWLPPPDRNVTQAIPPGSASSLATPYTVPAGQYFVMGDNRTDSADSRFYGPVPRSDLVGEVVFRYWPLGRLGSV